MTKTKINWNYFPNFERSEFDSPDKPGSGDNMSIDLLDKLQAMRNLYKKPIFVTSGYRTEKHNTKVGGTTDSAHLKGLAVDISCLGSRQRFRLISIALMVGFTRIGIKVDALHLDLDSSKPQNVAWLYR